MTYEEIIKTEDVPEKDNKLLRILARAVLCSLAATVAAELIGLGGEKKKSS